MGTGIKESDRMWHRRRKLCIRLGGGGVSDQPMNELQIFFKNEKDQLINKYNIQ